MANNRTLRVVVSADPKPSLSQLEKDIQALSSQLASGGSKIVVPVEISGFKADKAIDKLKTDIENALKNMSVNINGIQVTGGSGNSGGSDSGSGGSSGGRKKSSIIDESSLKEKAYFSDSATAIKEVQNELIAAGQSIKNIKTSVKETNGEVSGFVVEMKNALGNTEKLEYALKQVKTSAGQVKDAYVQIGKSTVDNSGGALGLTEIKKEISSIEGSLDFDALYKGT